MKLNDYLLTYYEEEVEIEVKEWKEIVKNVYTAVETKVNLK